MEVGIAYFNISWLVSHFYNFFNQVYEVVRGSMFLTLYIGINQIFINFNAIIFMKYNFIN